MAIYEFEAMDGHGIELEVPMSVAPPVGAVIVTMGKPYRRKLSRLKAGVGVQENCHFVSHSLPYNYPYHKGEFDDQGRCLFSSWKEVQETEARANHHGENLHYD